MNEIAETKKTAVKKAAEKPKMYVGPTIPGVAVQNVVYTHMPDEAAEAVKKCPSIANLFIPVLDYPKAEKQIRERRGYVFSAYNKALEFKEKMKEGGTAES